MTDLTATMLQDVMVGEACSHERHNLEVTYPVVNGIIQQWDDMQHVWDHTFHEQLQIDPKDCKILLTDPPLNPKGNREKLLQTMFETYGFAAAFIQIQAVLTLYAQGTSLCMLFALHCNVSGQFAVIPQNCKPTHLLALQAYLLVLWWTLEME